MEARARANDRGDYDGLNSRGRRDLTHRITKNEQTQMAMQFSLHVKLFRCKNWTEYNPAVFEFFTLEEYDYLFDSETVEVLYAILKSREDSLNPIPPAEIPCDITKCVLDEFGEEQPEFEELRAAEQAVQLDMNLVSAAYEVLGHSCHSEFQLPVGNIYPQAFQQAPRVHALFMSNDPVFDFRTRAQLRGCAVYLSRILQRIRDIKNRVNNYPTTLFNLSIRASLPAILFYFMTHVCQVPKHIAYKLLFIKPAHHRVHW